MSFQCRFTRISHEAFTRRREDEPHFTFEYRIYLKIVESSGTKKSDVADKKWEEYTEQEIKLKENYLKWKQKQMEKGANEEDLLTEEQYISQVYFATISPRIHLGI